MIRKMIMESSIVWSIKTIINCAKSVFHLKTYRYMLLDTCLGTNQRQHESEKKGKNPKRTNI